MVKIKDEVLSVLVRITYLARKRLVLFYHITPQMQPFFLDCLDFFPAYRYHEGGYGTSGQKGANAMSLRAVRNISNALAVGVIIVTLTTGLIQTPAAVVMCCVIAVVFVAALVTISLKFWRCPSCGRWLGRDVPQYCPHCGEHLKI